MSATSVTPVHSASNNTQVQPLSYENKALIPHPNDIKKPEIGAEVDAYFVVSVGQAVGVFYTWCAMWKILCEVYTDILNDRDRVYECIEGVSEAVYAPFHSFVAAHCVYEYHYHAKKLRACPIPGGMFWPLNSGNSSPAASSSSGDLWDQLEDLSEHFNSISLPSPDVSSSSSNGLWNQLEDLSEHFNNVSLPSPDVSSSSSDCLWDQVEDISEVLRDLDI